MSNNEEIKTPPTEITEAEATQTSEPVVDAAAAPTDAPAAPVDASATPEITVEEEQTAGSWTIYVKTLTGKTVTLTVEDQGECLVSTLKDLLQAQEGYVRHLSQVLNLCL